MLSWPSLHRTRRCAGSGVAMTSTTMLLVVGELPPPRAAVADPVGHQDHPLLQGSAAPGARRGQRPLPRWLPGTRARRRPPRSSSRRSRARLAKASGPAT
jgi:hypothetical protein